MLNNGAKWYNLSPPRWSFIAGLLKKPKKQRQSCRTVFTMCLFGGVQRPSICSAPLIIHIGS